MKTIWSLIFIVSVCVMVFLGMRTVSDQALISNPNLDPTSLSKIAQYDDRISDLDGFTAINVSTRLSSNGTEEVDPFFREQAENKNNVEKARDALAFVYKVPTLFILAIPFISPTSTALAFYSAVIWILLAFIVLLALYKAVRTGKVDEDS